MEDQILSNLDNPGQLERLYRSDKPTFKRSFKSVYPQLKDHTLVGYWNERLNFAGDEISWGTSKDLAFVIIASFLAGMIAKLPHFFSLNEEFFYYRNIGFVVFPALFCYFAWKNRLSAGKILFGVTAMLTGLIFINTLPDLKKSDTLILSGMHLILFLWSVTGFSFIGTVRNSYERRLGFLKYNGDLVVMTALVAIAGGILSGMTLGLFSLIGIDIEKFYVENVLVFGLAATPIAGTYLTQTNPQLVGKVSPLIARIFSPLVLVMLVAYLTAMVFSGKDPYTDRDFLIIFNALLIGVMAIIFFSVSETSKETKKVEILVLALLSVVTVAVNSIALSAILFRISEWGITPNRAAVLGSNILVLINLLMVTVSLFRVLMKRSELVNVGYSIAAYLPVYCIWTIIVTFVFPFVFGFK